MRRSLAEAIRLRFLHKLRWIPYLVSSGFLPAVEMLVSAEAICLEDPCFRKRQLKTQDWKEEHDPGLIFLPKDSDKAAGAGCSMGNQKCAFQY